MLFISEQHRRVQRECKVCKTTAAPLKAVHPRSHLAGYSHESILDVSTAAKPTHTPWGEDLCSHCVIYIYVSAPTLLPTKALEDRVTRTPFVMLQVLWDVR